MQTKFLEEMLGELKEISRALKGRNQTNNEFSPELFDVNEVSEILKVPKTWLYGNVSSKKIPYRKIGSRLRFTKDDINQMVKRYPSDNHAPSDPYADNSVI